MMTAARSSDMFVLLFQTIGIKHTTQTHIHYLNQTLILPSLILLSDYSLTLYRVLISKNFKKVQLIIMYTQPQYVSVWDPITQLQ
jgi:hypothetical protein